MQQYKKEFDAIMKVKSEPNQHEKMLVERAQKYIRKLSWIPGIEMIAVGNSLSMFATHADSDIDLFIITKPHHIWLVRFLVTFVFWILWVWRHGEDIAGNFCLSFFITTEAMNLEKIVIKNDIYLYNWIYYLKPILVRNNTYEAFLEENSWVNIPEEQKKKNLFFVISKWNEEIPFFSTYENYIPKSLKMNLKGIPHGMTEPKTSSIYIALNKLVRFFFLPRTMRSYKKLGQPEWVIISEDMLKFHDADRRKEVRDRILEKNFDK